MQKKPSVSISVVRRLPRYYRFLEELLKNGVQRISSQELAKIMDLTASQIRQDLNCFGGFGQQGYGYNVPGLFAEIGKILGTEKGYRLVLIGASNLGKTIALHMDFDQRGFNLIGIFEKSPHIIGQHIHGHTVQDVADIGQFCEQHSPLAAALCIPKEAAEELIPQLVEAGIKAFWNFSHYDINVATYPDIVVENVHLGDSMMALCYLLKEQVD